MAAKAINSNFDDLVESAKFSNKYREKFRDHIANFKFSSEDK